MNKNRYRVIFSKSKNMFIAVAENIKSQTKAAGQSSNSNHIDASSEVRDSKSFHQLWQVKSIVASMSLLMAFSPVYAQMQADSNANVAKQASIGVGQNQQGQNVPVINIQTPKNGVSHNVYNQFDVLQPGVVLNNSRNGAGSVIVGQVGANPYLQTGEARVILNEVNSAAASRFEGNLEVAGQRADVIIANPSGINIQGGGFINANKAIFTTGKTQLNDDGSINKFVVDQGKINVNSTENNLGLGGNNNNADYVDIYAKAIELNAQVHANQNIQVVTGSNNISEDLTEIKTNKPESTSPTFALDVKALGGMYANNIFIVGTDKGLGVRNAGIIQSPKNIVITSEGKIENRGKIQNTNSKESLLSISAGDGADIINFGSMSTNGNFFLESGSSILLDGGQVEKHGIDNSNIISMNAKKNIALRKDAKIENKSGDIYLDAKDLSIDDRSNVISEKKLNLTAKNTIKIINNSVVHGTNGLEIRSDNRSEILDSAISTKGNDINIVGLGNTNNSTLSFRVRGEARAKIRIRDSENNIILTDVMDESKAKIIELDTKSPYVIVNLIDRAGNVSKDARVEKLVVSTDMILKNSDIKTGGGNLNIYSQGNTLLNGINIENKGLVTEIINSNNTMKFRVRGEVGATLRVKDPENNILVKDVMNESGANIVQFDTKSAYVIVNLIDKAGNVSKDVRVDKPFIATEVKSEIQGSININSNKDIIWDNTDNNSPVMMSKLDLQATGSLKIKGPQFVANKGINLLGGELGIDTQLKSNQGINLTASENDVNLNSLTDILSVADINVAALKGNINATNININSDQGKISLLAQGDINLKRTPSSDQYTRPIIIDGNKDIIVGSIGSGVVNIKGAKLKSAVGGVKIQSGNIANVSDSEIKSEGNSELSAKENLTINSVLVNSQKHIALNAKNIDINYDPLTSILNENGTLLNPQGILSIKSNNNLNTYNNFISAGLVNIEVGANFINHGRLNINTFESAFLATSGILSEENGDLSIQVGNNFIVDPKKINLSILGDIEFISKNGALTLLGYGGNTGNGSEEVIKLNTINGGIRLEGVQVELQGSQLEASKDIKIISTDGNVLIDGIKKIVTKGTNKHDSNLLNYIEILKSNIKNIKTSLVYSELENKINIYQDLKNQNQNNLFSTIRNTSKYIADDDTGTNIKLEYIDPVRFFVREDDERGWYIGVDLTTENAEYSSIKRYYLKDNTGRKPDLVKKYLLNINNSLVELTKLYKKLDKYNEEIKKIDNDIKEVDLTKTMLNNKVAGTEHKKSLLQSNNGSIEISSLKGISISGSELLAKNGFVNIEAQGSLVQVYKSNSLGKDNNPTLIGASIIIDGTQDFYDDGNEIDSNYSFRTLVNPTVIDGFNGVNIRAVGKTQNDNLVLQATGVISQNGDVKVESIKNILFDSAIEQSYDHVEKNEKKKSWGGLKKKYITTRTENESIDAASVEIHAKNISIESKEPSNPNNSIDIYSGKLDAEGNISIRSGGNINFYTVNESSSSTEDVTKKSSFAGIKYNNSKTNSTRSQVAQIPATLKADYIGVKSDFDTRLVGTEFEYLKGATIESGGTIFIQPAITNITETLKKESNSVVWQSMQDKGSITETGKLPSFNGPVLPVFKAEGKGGLVVQIPIGEKDQNQVELMDEVIKLSNQPGNEYLKEFVKRDDVDWQKVILTQKDWDYKSQGLTAAGAAIIAIIVAAVTAGAGVAGLGTIAPLAGGGTVTTFGGITLATTTAATATVAGVTTYTTAGLMVNAAITSIATQASIGLVNNGGDVSKTFKELGDKETVKGLVNYVVTAGLLNQVGAALNLKPDSTLLSDRVINNFTNSVGSSLVQTAVNGGNLQDNLEAALSSGLVGIVQGQLAFEIKPLENIDYIFHKIAHAAAGCLAASIQKQCEAGAIGASIGEVVASYLNDGSRKLSENEREQIINKSKIVAATIATLTNHDVNIAALAADMAVRNNNMEYILEIERENKFLEGLSPAEQAEWNAEFQKANLATAEIALFVSTLHPGAKLGKWSVDASKSFLAWNAARQSTINVLRYPKKVWGKNLNEIVADFNKAGYKTTVRQSIKGSKNAEIIEVKNHSLIQQIQVHPGGGRHGGSYYKISTSDRGIVKVVDKKTYIPIPGEKATIIFK